MQHFERDFATAERPVRLIKLEQNYRSHGTILDAANALIRHNQSRLGKNLWTDEGRGEPVRVFSAPSDFDEAAFVVDIVKGLADEGVSLSEIGLLYRSNAQSRVLEHALFAAGIPYRVYGGMRFFERAEVKHALAYLRLIAEPGDDGALLRVINFPPRGIGARSLEQLQGHASGAGHDAMAGGMQRHRRRKGGRGDRAVRQAHRGAACADAGVAVAGGGRARDRALRARRALRKREGRSGPHREPAGAGQRRRQLRARSRDRHRCADAVRPRRDRRRVTGGRAAGRRDRPADRVPRARCARSGRHAGGRGPSRACS